MRVPSPATVGTVVREKYYYPGKSGRVPSRWRIGHVRTEPAIDGRKEGRKLSPSAFFLPFVTSAFEGKPLAGMRSHASEERRNLAVFRPTLYKSRGGGGKKVVEIGIPPRARAKLGQSERPDLNIFRTREIREPFYIWRELNRGFEWNFGTKMCNRGNASFILRNTANSNHFPFS